MWDETKVTMWDETKADRVFVYQVYCPPTVKEVIASGTSAFVGEVDESTVMKYPLGPGGDMSRLEIEKKLLDIVGPHERIIGLKDNEPPLLQQWISWCREAAEAIAWIHSRGVIHCDIQLSNLLLDGELHIKLSDFQGKHLSEDGTVLLDGLSSEPARFYCPRADPFDADIKTDLFALGCTIYLIMMGHAVFPEIIDGEEEWYEKVRDKFEKQQFPQESHACSAITSKCWLKEYESAEELLRDIDDVEKGLRTGEATQLD